MDKPDFPDDGRLASKGALKGRHLVVIALVAIAVGALAVYYFQERRRADWLPKPKDIVKVPEGSRAVTLFFADPDDQALVTETRLVAIGKEYVEQIRQVIDALLDGPEHSGVSTIADNTRLLDAFYDPEGATIYLDFTSEIVAGHPGGSSAEYFTIAAIVRTVSQNFPEVQAVQVLVEGSQVGTIAGHIDAYAPFVVDEWR
ncbi:MAG: GerMN domain-containing protein [Candidatus Krumholzibacteriia bacterium]